MSVKIAKLRKKKVDDIPSDCWNVITSFFRETNTIFNLQYTCEYFLKLTRSPHLFLCPHVLFTLCTKRSSVKSLGSGKVCRFVRRLNITPDHKVSLFSQKFVENHGVMMKIFNKFPRLVELEINACKVRWENPYDYDEPYKIIDKRVFCLTPYVFTFLPTSVTKLHLHSNFFYQKGYGRHGMDTFLKSVRNVEELILEEWDFTKRLGSLSDMKNLRKLKMIEYGSRFTAPKNQKSFPFESETLEELTLVNLSLKKKLFSDDYSKVELRFPNLRKLRLRPCESLFLKEIDRVIKHINKQELIEFELCVEESEVHHFFDVSGFSKKQDDKSLLLDAKIQEMTNLKVLDICGTNVFSGIMFTRIYEHLKRLDIGGCWLIEGSYLKGLKCLESLNISKCRQKSINNDVLRSLSKNLRYLYMNLCSQDSISDEGFKDMKNLRELQIIGCSQSGITMSIIDIVLNNNKKLIRLCLEREGRKILIVTHSTRDEMKKKLRRITITNTTVDEGGEGIDLGEMSIWIDETTNLMHDDRYVYCKDCKKTTRPYGCDVCCEYECGLCYPARCDGCGSNGCKRCVEFHCEECESLFCGSCFDECEDKCNNCSF